MTLAVIMCGDRNWISHEKIRDKLIELCPDVVIQGEAQGADIISKIEAEQLGINVESYPAEWNKYGRAAGPFRNKQMLNRLLEYFDKGFDIQIVAFHSNISLSKGTKNMVDQAKRNRVFTEIIT